MPDIAYAYTLAFRTPVSIFTGLGVAGLVDRAVVRNATGLPYIPGSSVKGRLRFFLERLLRSGAAPESYRIHPDDQPRCKDLDHACTLCRLFGNPTLPALVQVGQAVPSAPWDTLLPQLLAADPNPVIHPDADIRPGVALSRQRRTARPDHLFFDETTPAITFAGNMFVDTRVTVPERRVLTGVGRLVDALGSRKAVGRGRLAEGIQIEEAAP